MTESGLIDRNHDPYKCCQQEIHFRFKETDWKWMDGKRYSMQMETKRMPE